MKKRSLAATCLGIMFATSVWAQSNTATPLPKFQATDVRIAAYRNQPFANGGVLRGDRYIWHQATLVDLIADAYGVDGAMVQGGPPWLERDRFEVIGLADPKTSSADLKLMLRSLLVERFGLVIRQGEKEMPAYVLRAGKDAKSKLQESESESGNCEPVPPAPGAPTKNAPIEMKCHGMTMAAFATQLRLMGGGGGYFSEPVVDKTELKGAYDFQPKWHAKPAYDQLGADGISIFDALDKQMGLKLALETSPQHVWLVDTANRKPTPNATDIAQKLPPLPQPVFDVATVKPSAPDERGFARISGGQINVQAVPLKFFVQFAWDLNPTNDDEIVGAPKWLSEDKFDILAKAAVEGSAKAGPQALSIDIEDLRDMLKTLLIERFQMKVHSEDRPISAYTLYAGTPKLKKADPSERTKCFEGPGPDGKDPRKTNVILNRLLTCQNMTSAEIADELQRVASGYIHGPVLDKTGLDGSYDFTLSFSSSDKTNGLPPSNGSSSDASDPSGAITLYDAVSKQLGLKLVKEKRPMPVLVIDSMQEKPLEN